MLNQWQPLFTCYLSLTFIHFYVFTKVLNYQQWILGKCLSFIHINLWTNIAGNSNTFENKIKDNTRSLQTYTKIKPTHIQKNIYQFFLHMQKLPTTAQKDLINEPTEIITEIITSHTFTCLFLYLYIYHQYVMKGSNRRESLCHHTVVNILRILRYIIDYHITHHVSLQRSLLHFDVPVSYSS